MDERTYQKTTLKQMQGKQWVTNSEMTNGWGVIPAGTRVRIVDKRSGLVLAADACLHCGLSARISRVHRSEVDEVVTA